MNADIKSPFRAGAKVLSVAIMVLLVIGALGPANWTPRTALGWQTDHFLGYFAITLLVCFAWPRPFLVGGPSWPPRSCWKVYKHLHRIGQLILWRHYVAQAGCWRRLYLLNSSVEHGDGIVRVLRTANRAFSRARQSADSLADRRRFASSALQLVLGCGQIALFTRQAILDYTVAE